MTPRGLCNPARPGWRPSVSRRPTVMRHKTGLVLLAGALTLIPVTLALIPVTAWAEDPCAAHFPKLRAVVTATGPDRPVPAADKAALVEELAIERVLWEDEVTRQRQRLDTVDPVTARVASARLDRVAADVGAVLTALGHHLDTDTALDKAVTDRVLACAGNGDLVPRWPIASAAPSPLPPLPHRTPAPGQPAPPGYFDPPTGAGAGALAGEGTIVPLRLATANVATSATANADDAPTDPVAAKASELSNDPVAIYGFVRDGIRAEHYHGAAKSPATVLASGSGNDADQAGLLAALLRAAGFPARLVWGVVELPRSVLLGHFAVADATALEAAMTGAGIPWTPVIEGGQPVAYRLERVWAEVWLPYANFRGVLLDRSGTTWVPLDPELKTHLPATTRRILDEMALDATVLRTEVLSGAACSGDLTLPDACPALRDVLVGRLDQYLQDHGDTERWASLAVPPPLPVRDEPILPATLAGKIVAVHGWGIDLPESLTHRISFTVTAAGVSLLEATLPVSALAGRGAVLWYAPATPDDATIVEAYGGYLWDVPPYLLNVTPVITAGSEELARGTAGLGMGRPFDLATLLTTPGGQTASFENAALAGVPVGLGIAPGRQGYQPAGSEPVNTVEMLSLLATEYLDQTDTFRNELAAVDGLTVVHPFPSLAAVASVVAVQGNLGLVTGLDWQGVVIDADLDGSEVAGRTAAGRQRWHLLEGLQASTLERRIFESREITSITADKAMMLATLGGTPIVHITRDNLQTALDALPYDANIEAELAAWVLGGGEADIPATPQALLAWQGVGYLLTDPATGQARYQLAGALSGGMTAVPAWELSIGELKDITWPPSQAEVNRDPNSVSVLEASPLCQDRVGRVGEPGPCRLQVRAVDRLGRPVAGAFVRFDVAVGDGSLVSSDGAETPTLHVLTNARGLGDVGFRFSQHTDPPYYVDLGPGDPYPTRVGLNGFTASNAACQCEVTLSQFSRPGPLASLRVRSTQFGRLPSVLAAGIEAVVRDSFGNPLANVALDAQLTPADGSLLTREEHQMLTLAGKAAILLAEVPVPTAAIAPVPSDSAGWFVFYVVLGPSQAPAQILVHAVEGGAERQVAIDLEVAPPAPDSVVACWSARPVNPQGEWSEAYSTSAALSKPLSVDVLRERDGHIERAPRDDYRVLFGLDPACPAGSQLLSAPPPPHEGGWATGMRVGSVAGRCTLKGDIQAREDDQWHLRLTTSSPPVFTLEAWVEEPVPFVPLRENGQGFLFPRRYPYTLLPEAYPAASTSLVFEEAGREVGWATTEGRGPGWASLGPINFFGDLQADHRVRVEVNRWHTWDGSPAGAAVKLDPQPLTLAKLRFQVAPTSPVEVSADDAAAVVVAVADLEDVRDPEHVEAIGDGSRVRWQVEEGSGLLSEPESTTDHGLAGTRLQASTATGSSYRVRGTLTRLVHDEGEVELDLASISERLTVVPGLPRQLALTASKDAYRSDGTDSVLIDAAARDQRGNLVSDETDLSWRVEDSTTELENLQVGTVGGHATVLVRAPRMPVSQLVRSDFGTVASQRTAAVSPVAGTLTATEQSLDIALQESTSLTLAAAVAEGTPVFWTASNGTILGQPTIARGTATATLSTLGGRVGPVVVTATLGDRLLLWQGEFVSSAPLWAQVSRPALVAGVPEDGVEVVVHPDGTTREVPYFASTIVDLQGPAGAVLQVATPGRVLSEAYTFETMTGDTVPGLVAGNPMQVTGGALDPAHPHTGTASLLLSGSGYGEIPDAAAFAFVDSFDVQVWVRPTSLQPSMLVEKPGSWRLEILADGRLRGSVTTMSGEYVSTSLSAVPLDTWSSVGLQLSAGVLRVFLSSEAAAAFGVLGQVATTTTAVRLGEGFSGNLDDLAFAAQAAGAELLRFDGVDALSQLVLGSNGRGAVRVWTRGVEVAPTEVVSLNFDVEVVAPGNAARAGRVVVKLNVVSKTLWVQTCDGVMSFLGGDPETVTGIASNIAGGMLVIGDIGSLVKNMWRAVGASDKEFNAPEFALSGLGLLTEFAVGEGEIADAPISAARSVVAFLGDTPFTRFLVDWIRRLVRASEPVNQVEKNLLLRAADDLADGGRITDTLNAIVKSSDIFEAAARGFEKFGDEFLDVVDALRVSHGDEVAAKVVKVLGESPDEILDLLKAGGNLADASADLAKVLKNGQVHPQLLKRVLENCKSFPLCTDGYGPAKLLADLGEVAETPGFVLLVKRMKASNVQVHGYRYELEVAVALKKEGRTVQFIEMLYDGGKRDIDLVAGGIMWQVKSTAGAMGSVKQLKDWVAQARKLTNPPGSWSKVGLVIPSLDALGPSMRAEIRVLRNKGLQLAEIPHIGY